jgi:UDP-N-acetylmuramyl pentapeptide phosphotransferase/UDP-N-acetylglucosamine-1-phosphate transferase
VVVEVWQALAALVASALICALIVSTQKLHGRLTRDTVGGSPQKFSPHAVPRVGGVALFIAMGLVAGYAALSGTPGGREMLVLMLAAIPALLGGLLEDLTKRIPVGSRLLFTFVSATIAFFVLDARIDSVDLPFFDVLLAGAVGSLLFTLFAVGGMAHAMNIIDGFNGLFGVCALLVLAGIAWIAFHVGDAFVLAGALIAAGAVMGFLLFNYPRGYLFAGDGGAYFVGFVIAELAVLLVHRNSEVSPWFALTVLVYPVFETFFSMYRKQLVRGRSAGKPDGSHLHMLVYRRVVRWHPGSRLPEHQITRNALTSPYLWLLCSLGVGAAVYFWNNTPAMEVCVLAFALLYVWLYTRIVRFRVPGLLILRNAGFPRQSGMASGAGGDAA